MSHHHHHHDHSHHHHNTDGKQEGEPLPLAAYLKANSRATHDSVDQLVMSGKPFDSKENYIKFLQLQSVFHLIVDSIYKNPDLNQTIPHLASLARYEKVVQDLHDLGAQAKTWQTALPQPTGAEALGWLYCAEGSNVGAAFLYKDAEQHLGLNAEHGARHLAAHADGRGKHWREFIGYFNQLPVSPLDREDALKGALNAFAFYKLLMREIFGLTQHSES